MLKRCLGTMAFALLSSVLYCAPRYEVVYDGQSPRVDRDEAIHLVGAALKIAEGDERYAKVNIAVHDKPFTYDTYFVVNLHEAGVWGISTARLDVSDGQVVNTQWDYVEESPWPEDFCATCPDPELQVLFGWAEDQSPETVTPARKKVEEAFSKAGYKFKSLVDGEETKEAIADYLSCPKMVLYGRIGHGHRDRITAVTKDEKYIHITSQDFASEPLKTVVQKKFFPFNSCYVAGSKKATLGRTIIQSGGTWMCGGDDRPIVIGTSELSWTQFMLDICSGTEVVETFNKHLKASKKDKWGAQSSGPGPFYPFKEGGF